jgi:hypothetical protein
MCAVDAFVYRMPKSNLCRFSSCIAKGWENLRVYRGDSIVIALSANPEHLCGQQSYFLSCNYVLKSLKKRQHSSHSRGWCRTQRERRVLSLLGIEFSLARHSRRIYLIWNLRGAKHAVKSEYPFCSQALGWFFQNRFALSAGWTRDGEIPT